MPASLGRIGRIRALLGKISDFGASSFRLFTTWSNITCPQATAVGDVQTVFVGTIRLIDPETGLYDTLRSEGMPFAQYDVSIPQDRKPGQIKFPRRGGKPNPRTDFLTTTEVLHASAKKFRSDIRHASLERPRGGHEAVIFVHGCNTNFSESNLS